MLFGLSWGLLGMSVLVILVGISIIISGSGIFSAVFILIVGCLFYFSGYVSLAQLLIYLSIYIGIGVVWATFRLIRDTKEKFKIESEKNKLKKPIPEEGTEEWIKYNEILEPIRKGQYIISDKELLSDIIKDISFDCFIYRVSFVPVDMIDYLLKDFFEKIKKMIRSYLFKTILGEKEN